MFKYAAVFALLVAFATALPSRRQDGYKSPMPRLQPRDGAVLPKRPDGKIINGAEASQGQFPHQAAVSIDNAYFCGGSLIATNYVVTAGHCTTGSSTIEVTLGELNLNSVSGIEQVINSDRIVTHEDYGVLRVQNDIGLVELAQEADVSAGSDAAVIALATSGPEVGETTTISGWGKTSDDSNGVSSVLMWTTTTILDNSECEDYYGNSNEALQICLRGGSACNGDSGGPMTDAAGSVLYGVTSYGSSAGCESTAPNVYTKISGYNDWLAANMS